ncbi:MAG: hypothetical protein IID33_12610, partial [Planctomycetes bacterium]|nr:hypothetical protein [Planctomycetota bacterium]
MSTRDRRPPTGDDVASALARSEPPLDVAIDRLDPWAQDNAAPARPSGARQFQFGRLLRYKRSILGIALLIAVPSVAGIWLMIKPKYQARATLRISPSNPRTLFKTEDTGMIPMYQQHLNSQVGIILGRVILGRVIDETTVQETTWYKDLAKAGASSDDAAFEQLSKDLKVKPRGKTFLIDIDMTAPKRSDAVLIVERVVHYYLDYAKRFSLGTHDDRGTRLRDERRILKQKIDAHEEMTEQLSHDLLTRDPDSAISQQGAQVAAAEVEIRRLTRDLKLAEFQMGELKKLLENDADKDARGAKEDSASGDGPSRPVARYEDDLGWRQAFLKLQSAEDSLERDSVGLGEKHPKLQLMRVSVEQTRKRLEEIQARLDLRWAGGTTPGVAAPGESASLSGAIAALERKIGGLTLAIKLQEEERDILLDKFNESFGNARVYDQEMKELSFDRQQYDLIRERLYQTDMEGAT